MSDQPQTKVVASLEHLSDRAKDPDVRDIATHMLKMERSIDHLAEEIEEFQIRFPKRLDVD